MEEELEKLKPAGLPADKQSWNIEDLQNYIANLALEKVRETANEKHVKFITKRY